MAYFLRIYSRSRGQYLQIVESFRNKEKKCTSHKSFKSLGYLDDLVASGIADPISFYKLEVKKLNQERKQQLINSKTRKIGDVPLNKNLGCFVVKSMFDKLKVDGIINIMTQLAPFNFNISDLLRLLVYSRIIKPCSKCKTVEEVFPSIYNNAELSLSQIYDGLEYIGNDYQKFIDVFNFQINKIYGRNTDTVFFDCTNYYFEIDVPKDDKQKGPSKENRISPIIGQALLLDANQIPIAMEMFPGNESEKPYIRKAINNMKNRYKLSGKTIQVADKGLNCGQNIAEAIKNGDGYIFSKSVHGKNLSVVEKKWILLNKDYVDILDKNGKIKCKLKECIDEFEYKFMIDGKSFKRKFKEKRVVSFNPILAKKQQMEIKKQIDKITSLTTINAIEKNQYGDAIKYVKFENNVNVSLDFDKIEEDLNLCGYNLIVTSELDKSAKEIYEIYHGLWRIEESFRIMKSELDARPVYLQKKESIYGHFLICYLSLVILRLLEFKVFNSQLNTYDLVEFIRCFNITEAPNDIFINSSRKFKSFDIIKSKFKLECLDNAFLTKKDIEMVYSAKI